MNQTTNVVAARPTRLDAFTAEMMPAEKREQLVRGLPKHINPDLFERNLLNALMSQPDLMKCDPREVFREVMQVAALGLLLDPQLGEAYLIAGYSGREQRHKPQRRVGYRGLIKLARQSGEVSTIYAHPVYEHDTIDVNLGTSQRFDHRPNIFGERGRIIGFYAVVKYRDGTDDFETMSLAEVEAVRDRYSDSWKAWKAGKIKKPPPWETDLAEMGRKTVIRRLVKRVPQSPELQTAINWEEQQRAREAEPEALSPPRGRPRLASALSQLARPRGQDPEPEPEIEPEEEPGEELPEHDAETGEIAMDPAAKAELAARLELIDALTSKAHEGTKKLRWFRARLRPEQLALVREDDWRQFEELAKLADNPPRAEQQDAEL